MREPVNYPDFVARFYDVVYKQIRSQVDEIYFLHYRSIQNRFLKPQFGFKIPLNSINRQVQDRQFADPLSEVVTPS